MKRYTRYETKKLQRWKKTAVLRRRHRRWSRNTLNDTRDLGGKLLEPRRRMWIHRQLLVPQWYCLLLRCWKSQQVLRYCWYYRNVYWQGLQAQVNCLHEPQERDPIIHNILKSHKLSQLASAKERFNIERSNYVKHKCTLEYNISKELSPFIEPWDAMIKAMIVSQVT